MKNKELNVTKKIISSEISSYFNGYLTSNSIFKNRNYLQSHHIPDEIVHRDNELKIISKILAPGLKLEKPSNLFIYGKTGTGKTLCVKKISDEITKISSKNNISLKIFYINCKLKKSADTEYRLIASLARLFNKAIPVTGLPTDEVYNILFNTIDEKNGIIIFILDEIDYLVKKTGDEIIYNLTRINSDLKKSKISIIGISNDLGFANNLDPRVKSSLGEEEVVFPPYNALQLQTILSLRADYAFNDGVLAPGVIQKCAAYAAREHGDARRALELLRVAGELAERGGCNKVTIDHLDSAENRIEKEKFIEIIRTQPKQFQAVLYAIFKSNNLSSTGDIYNNYVKLCDFINLRPLTQRRVSDIINELDMLGIITAKVISKGRFGRSKEISINLPNGLVDHIELLLKKELEI